MEILKKFIDKSLYWITVLLFALLVIVVVWQVFSRQVMGDPATWTDEGARLTFVWLGLFASALVFGERGHIAVEFLARKLSTSLERALSILTQMVVLAFSAVVLIWGGWRTSQNAWNQDLSALPFTIGHMYLAIPVAGLLIVFYAIYFIQSLVRGIASPYVDSSEEDDPQVQVKTHTGEAATHPASSNRSSSLSDEKTDDGDSGIDDTRKRH